MLNLYVCMYACVFSIVFMYVCMNVGWRCPCGCWRERNDEISQEQSFHHRNPSRPTGYPIHTYIHSSMRNIMSCLSNFMAGQLSGLRYLGCQSEPFHSKVSCSFKAIAVDESTSLNILQCMYVCMYVCMFVCDF